MRRRRTQGLELGSLPAVGAIDQEIIAEGGGGLEDGGGAGRRPRHQVLGRHQALHPVPAAVGDQPQGPRPGGVGRAVRVVGTGGLQRRGGGGGDEAERAQDVAGGGAGEAGELPGGAFPQRDQIVRCGHHDEAQVFLPGNPGHDNGRDEDIEQRLRKLNKNWVSTDRFYAISCYNV